jgi:putative nucleotidyltransferase with HDIG domain
MNKNDDIMNTNKLHILDHNMLNVDLRQAVIALAEALDLVGIDEYQHGERVAYMATTCARRLHWDDQAIDDIFHAGLLHDCGVSSSVVHKKLIAEMDWEGSELHCILGEYYLKNVPPLAYLAPIIRHHHTHWNALKKLELPKSVLEASNLIYLVDRVDALQAQLKNDPNTAPYESAAVIRERITAAAGEHFAPHLVEAFLQVSDNDAFWLTMEPLHLTDFMARMQHSHIPQLSHFDDIHKLACIFAHIVDAKSSYTYDHSLGVSRVAKYLAEKLDLPLPRVQEIELAGLLHDLGKLGVPDEILEKSGPLSAEESAIMHRHSYESFRILNRIKGFERIAEWAGNHHETLLGDGYPFHHEETELGIEARIIAVADIFQALAQDRPYRKAMAASEIVDYLKTLANEGKIDAEIVTLTANEVDNVWQIATIPNDEWSPLFSS